MTHYGKRSPGSLTAANPGDTLYFCWGSYNDSGDSEAASGFATGDIEVFKNGLPTSRATDSGYSLISDTGQMGDRVGLNRFSVSIFNTSDDTGFYDAGSWYQVAVDSVSIDGKTVRFWAGSFEIGFESVDVRRIVGDTGTAQHLRQAFDVQNTNSDTGLIANAAAVRVQTDKMQFDTGANEIHADLRKVNNIQIQGAGDTGTGNTWRPA